MPSLRRLLAVVLIPFALAPAAADDAKPAKQPDRLVVRAKLPVPPAAPAAAVAPGAAAPAPKTPDPPVVTVTTDEKPARVLPAAVTVGTDGVVEAVVSAQGLGVSGYVQIEPATAGRGLVLAFRDELRGEVDLGAIAFGDQCPVLAAGRVETAQKAPVVGAAVNVQFQTSAWQTLEFKDLAATTDAAGAFTIRADVRNRRGVMFAKTDGRWKTTNPASLLKPTKDVRLVAAATTEVLGTVAVPEGLDLADLVVVVSGAAGSLKTAVVDGAQPSRSADAEWAAFPARSKFVVTGLVAGRYDLRLRFRDAAKALVELPDVDVGEATSQLPPLTLDVPVRRVRVRVAGEDGAVPAGAKLYAREKGDRGKFREVTLAADGTARVATLSDEVSLAAHAPGTSWAFASASGEDASLRVEPLPGTPIRVMLPLDALRGDGEVDVAITLAWRAEPDVLRGALASRRDPTDPRESEIVELPFPVQDPPEGRVALPGWYELSLRVRRGAHTLTRPLQAVRVQGEALHVVQLEMTAEELNEIVRSMDGH